MTSSRLVLVFLGIIFLIIIILSSNRIGQFARERFGRFLPNVKLPYQQLSPTPTAKQMPSPTSSTPGNNSANSGQTPQYQANGSVSNNQYYSTTTKGGYQTTNQIPATGPNEIVTLLLAGSGIVGFYINKKLK